MSSSPSPAAANQQKMGQNNQAHDIDKKHHACTVRYMHPGTVTGTWSHRIGVFGKVDEGIDRVDPCMRRSVGQVAEALPGFFLASCETMMIIRISTDFALQIIAGVVALTGSPRGFQATPWHGITCYLSSCAQLCCCVTPLGRWEQSTSIRFRLPVVKLPLHSSKLLY
jgi:hypothetical protein